MGHQVSFKFLSSIQQNDLSLLQSSFIYQQINILENKRAHILQKWNFIFEKWRENSKSHHSKTYHDLEIFFRKEVCSDFPNAFWKRIRHMVFLPCEKDFN